MGQNNEEFFGNTADAEQATGDAQAKIVQRLRCAATANRIQQQVATAVALAQIDTCIGNAWLAEDLQHRLIGQFQIRKGNDLLGAQDRQRQNQGAFFLRPRAGLQWCGVLVLVRLDECGGLCVAEFGKVAVEHVAEVGPIEVHGNQIGQRNFQRGRGRIVLARLPEHRSHRVAADRLDGTLARFSNELVKGFHFRLADVLGFVRAPDLAEHQPALPGTEKRDAERQHRAYKQQEAWIQQLPDPFGPY